MSIFLFSLNTYDQTITKLTYEIYAHPILYKECMHCTKLIRKTFPHAETSVGEPITHWALLFASKLKIDIGLANLTTLNAPNWVISKLTLRLWGTKIVKKK